MYGHVPKLLKILKNIKFYILEVVNNFSFKCLLIPHLSITALLAPHVKLFLVFSGKGRQGPSVNPVCNYFWIRAQRAFP